MAVVFFGMAINVEQARCDDFYVIVNKDNEKFKIDFFYEYKRSNFVEFFRDKGYLKDCSRTAGDIHCRITKNDIGKEELLNIYEKESGFFWHIKDGLINHIFGQACCDKKWYLIFYTPKYNKVQYVTFNSKEEANDFFEFFEEKGFVDYKPDWEEYIIPYFIRYEISEDYSFVKIKVIKEDIGKKELLNIYKEEVGWIWHIKGFFTDILSGVLAFFSEVFTLLLIVGSIVFPFFALSESLESSSKSKKSKKSEGLVPGDGLDYSGPSATVVDRDSGNTYDVYDK